MLCALSLLRWPVRYCYIVYVGCVIFVQFVLGSIFQVPGPVRILIKYNLVEIFLPAGSLSTSRTLVSVTYKEEGMFPLHSLLTC